MSSKTRQHAPETRPRPRHREPSYDSYDSYTDSSSEDSYSSDSEDDRRRRQDRKRTTPKQQYSSKNSTALTKTPPPVAASRRRALSEDRKRYHGRRSRRYDSDSDSYDSEESSGSDKSDNSDGESSEKGDMSVASSSYNKNKNKSKMEQRVDSVLDALGLLHIKRDSGQRQLSSPDPEKHAKQKAALQAAVTAAAIEAWRSHSKPGGFNLQKALRIAIAAIAAGGMDVLVDSHPGHESMKDIAEAIVGGLATSKALGGKITHRREGGAQGKMIDGFIALAASKMVKPAKPDEIEKQKKNLQRSKSVEPSRKRSSRSH